MAGDRSTLIPVEMRGLTYEGSIHEGDWVRVRGTAKAGTLRATRLENLTTSASVQAKGIPKAAYIAAISIFVLAVVALIIWTISDFNSTPSPPPGFPEP
ncbi:hypothetical protein ABZ478_32970 [Streptomyces sp. NPDC005706]|uniref:hypothetical protein n=1 Tax=Streptomyces sp. NPDC005706 TaxID=3157169 RepID=UPI0033C10FD8